MKHARADYDRFQDPALANPEAFPGINPIGENEPVFLLRARDAIAPAIVEAWAERYQEEGGNPNTVERVRDFAGDMRAWQKKNGSKMADCPEDER